MSVRPGPDETRLHVTYAYDADLPSRFAAMIQILATCRALCDLGAEVRVLTGSLRKSRDECLAHYGLEPHPRLRLVPVPWSAPPRARRRAIQAAVEDAGAARQVMMSRGEPGVLFFGDLRKLPGRDGRLHVYEAHRPCSAGPGPHRGPLRRRAWMLRLRRLERAAVTDADALVCLTEGARAALRGLYPVQCPTLVLPSGTTIPDGRPPSDETRDLDVVYAGKLESRKGVDVLLEAMRLLPEYRATIVGGLPRQVEDARQLAESIGVADRVSLPGFMPPSAIPALWRRARVAVCPLPSSDSVSREFTSPLKVLEAMANGAPVVASDLPTVRALTADGRAAVLVQPDRPEALAAGIRMLLEDRELAKKVADAGRAVAASHAWERRAERLLEFLQRLPVRRASPQPARSSWG